LLVGNWWFLRPLFQAFVTASGPNLSAGPLFNMSLYLKWPPTDKPIKPRADPRTHPRLPNHL
jgi:hypothetical protein